MVLRVGDVDPDLQSIARILPPGYGLAHGLKLPRLVMRLLAIAGADRDIEMHTVTRDVGLRLHRPLGLTDPAPVLLWIHGGGYVMGSARQEDLYCRRLSHLCGVTVAAVEHRLAPENPYPAALEDCYTALRWLDQQPWVNSTRLGIGGASAGGGLAAAVALLARDRGEVTPVGQMLVYPMLDDRTGTTINDRRHVMWSARDNQHAWRCYLRGADPAVAVPARHRDLTGLPAAWIGVGTLDLFAEECRAYGRRLRDADVPCHVEVVDGAFHAFDMMAPNARPSLKFFASQCEYLRRTLVD